MTFHEFFNLLYHYDNVSGLILKSLSKKEISKLPFYCAHEAQSLIASQRLINFTGGIADLTLISYYDVASFAFVAVGAAQNLLKITTIIPSWNRKHSRFFLHKLCNATTNYSQLREVQLEFIDPSNIGCLLQKSPNLELLSVFGSLDWDNLQSEDAAALVLPPYGTTLLNIRDMELDHLNIGDKGVEKLSQILQDSIFLETLSLDGNHISDDGASTIADLMKALPRLQLVDLDANNIGGTGAALLWNQSIHKCCNLSLDYNVIGDDRPDAFISTLKDTVNNGYERNKSCQLTVSMFANEFLCSDLRDIRTISKQLPKGVRLIPDDSCLEMTGKILKRFKYYLGKNHPLSDAVLQWISYVVCTFHIVYLSRALLWGLLYFVCCLSLFILSSFDYLVLVDFFIYPHVISVVLDSGG